MPTTYNLTVFSVCSSSFNASIGNKYFLVKSLTSSGSTVLVKQPGLHKSVTTTGTASKVLNISKIITALPGVSVILSLALTFARALSITTSAIASFVLSIGKVLSITSSGTARIVKFINKVFISLTSSISTTITKSCTKTLFVLQALAAKTSRAISVPSYLFLSVSTPTLSIIKGRFKTVTSTCSGVGTFTRYITTRLTATVSNSVSIIKAYFKILSTSFSSFTTLTTARYLYAKIFAVSSSVVGSLVKMPLKLFLVTSLVEKRLSLTKSLSQVLNAQSILVSLLIKRFLVIFSLTSPIIVFVNKIPTKLFSLTSSVTASCSKQTYKIFSLVVSGLTTLIKGPALTLAINITSSLYSTLYKTVNKTFISSSSTTISLSRTFYKIFSLSSSVVGSAAKKMYVTFYLVSNTILSLLRSTAFTKVILTCSSAVGVTLTTVATIVKHYTTELALTVAATPTLVKRLTLQLTTTIIGKISSIIREWWTPCE